MTIHSNSALVPDVLPGLAHRTAALSTASVVVRLPDGTPLDLPWK